MNVFEVGRKSLLFTGQMQSNEISFIQNCLQKSISSERSGVKMACQHFFKNRKTSIVVITPLRRLSAMANPFDRRKDLYM